MKAAVVVIVVMLVVGGGGYALVNNANKDSTSNKPANSQNESNDRSSNKSTPSQSSQATGTDFTINANDETADVMTLNVKKGDTVKVTFKVDSNNVYHGGLEFKSDVVSTKPIKPGDSDTVTFTADKPFDFTPYWYQSDVKKDYLIAVKVQ